MKYFATCTTLEALKKEYRRLCMIHHEARRPLEDFEDQEWH